MWKSTDRILDLCKRGMAKARDFGARVSGLPIALVGVTAALLLWIAAREHLVTNEELPKITRLYHELSTSPVKGNASMTPFNVDSTAGLDQALSHAHGGDKIVLASGIYANEVIRNNNYTGIVTITSQDASKPAIFENLKISKSSNLVFTKVELTGSTDNYAQSRVSFVHDISFDHVVVHGDVTQAPGTQLNGIYVSHSDNVTVTHSDFYAMRCGLVENSSTHLSDTYNAFHNLSKGGIEMGGNSDVTIEYNAFSDFHTSPKVHADAVQFYTGAALGGSSEIQVAHNLVARADGVEIQGIWMKDDARDLLYKDVKISDNTVIGGNWNSIFLDHSVGVVEIVNNTVETWPGYDPGTGSTTNFRAFIRMGDYSGADVTIRGNSAQGYMNASGHLVAPPSGNALKGDVADAGAARLGAWISAHASMLPSLNSDLLKFLKVTGVHSTAGF